jgi:hypothetical protein
MIMQVLSSPGSAPKVTGFLNEDVGTGEQSSRQVHYTFGRPVETVTMKDLCFLHHRDRTPTYERPVRDILSSGEAITWRDLQTLLKETQTVICSGF